MNRPSATNCTNCGKAIQVKPKGRVPLFCGDACRQAKHRYNLGSVIIRVVTPRYNVETGLFETDHFSYDPVHTSGLPFGAFEDETTGRNPLDYIPAPATATRGQAHLAAVDAAITEIVGRLHGELAHPEDRQRIRDMAVMRLGAWAERVARGQDATMDDAWDLAAWLSKFAPAPSLPPMTAEELAAAEDKNERRCVARWLEDAVSE